MDSKKKIVIAVSSIIMLVAAAVIAVISVLAARNVTIKSTFDVTYTPYMVEADVSTYYTIGANATQHNMGTCSLTDTNYFTITFNFKNNIDDMALIASIALPNATNFNMTYGEGSITKITASDPEFVSGYDTFRIEGATQVSVVMVFTIADEDSSARLNSDFIWKLTPADKL